MKFLLALAVTVAVLTSAAAVAGEREDSVQAPVRPAVAIQGP